MGIVDAAPSSSSQSVQPKTTTTRRVMSFSLIICWEALLKTCSNKCRSSPRASSGTVGTPYLACTYCNPCRSITDTKDPPFEITAPNRKSFRLVVAARRFSFLDNQKFSWFSTKELLLRLFLGRTMPIKRSVSHDICAECIIKCKILRWLNVLWIL